MGFTNDELEVLIKLVESELPKLKTIDDDELYINLLTKLVIEHCKTEKTK